VDDLFDLVQQSSINTALRTAILEALEKVRIAVSLYRIYGAKGLKANLQSLFGLVFTEREQLQQEKDDNANVIERLGNLIEKIDSMTAKALRIHKALTKPIRFLLGLVTKSDDSKIEKPATDVPDVTDT
jgi:hypothetical protein